LARHTSFLIAGRMWPEKLVNAAYVDLTSYTLMLAM
jgi:hypothetical protein